MSTGPPPLAQFAQKGCQSTGLELGIPLIYLKFRRNVPKIWKGRPKKLVWVGCRNSVGKLRTINQSQWYSFIPYSLPLSSVFKITLNIYLLLVDIWKHPCTHFLAGGAWVGRADLFPACGAPPRCQERQRRFNFSVLFPPFQRNRLLPGTSGKAWCVLITSHISLPT